MANCAQCGRQLPPLSFKKICQWCVQHEAAQRGEDQDYQPVITRPWARRESAISLTQIIFGANLAVFIAMAVASGGVMDFSNLDPRAVGANYGPLTLSGDWWRLLSYMFVHAGLIHIAFNMWCLWDLGRLCESLYGRWTFGAIYVITGVGGGLARLIWDPRVPSVGASGAIFGLAGALIASFYLGEFSLPREAISGTLRSLVVFAVFNLGFGQIMGGVDNACHVGGLVSGLILGALIARLAPDADNRLRRASVVGIVVLAAFAVGFGVRQWRGGPWLIARAYHEAKGDQVAKLQTLVRQQPELVQAHFALAQAYLAREQYPEAEAEFKRVITLEPKNIEAQFDLGVVYLGQKQVDDAKFTFQQILAQDSNSGQGHYGLGLVLEEQQNYAAAVEEFQKATSGRHPPGLYYEMGNSYAKLKRYDDAIAAYLKEKERGDDPDLENVLADAYEAKGMMKEAQAARDQASQLRGQGH